MIKDQDTSLRKYVLRRVLQAIPLVIAVIVFTFMMIHLFPGDIIYLIAGEGGSAEYYDFMRHAYGLDKPIYDQFVIYLTKILQGDLGNSLYFNQPVVTVVGERIPATLLLMISQFTIASILGVLLGLLAASRPGSKTDGSVIVLSLFWYSIPVFWSGQMLLYVFSLRLGLFPTEGMVSLTGDVSGFGYVLSVLRHLALPAVSLALHNVALLARVTRSSALEALREDYIVTALAKGVKERTIVFTHAFRNALLPVTTIIGLHLGVLFTGAVLTETVFSWPGIGRLTYDSISRRDYPVLIGIFIVVAVSVIIANLLTDILYAKLDPRVRYK